MLVAGVTGGASLIESAKIRGFMNEFDGYKRIIYIFVSNKGKLPGDLNNSGFIGHNSGQNYDDNSFGVPYVSTNNEYGLPDDYVAPWIDVYRAGIIDYEPKKYIAKSGKLTWNGGGSVPTIIEKNIVYLFDTFKNNDFNFKCTLNANIGNYLRSHSINNNIIKVEFAEKFDRKFDDGIYNSGIIRGQCNPGNGNSGYDTAVNCISIWYFLNI